MTNQNYMSLSSNDVLTKVYEAKQIISSKNALNGLLKKQFPEEYQYILTRTVFLDDFYLSNNKHVPILARIYCIEHDIHEHPQCSNPNCTNKVYWTSKNKFQRYCSIKCQQTDPIFREQMRQLSIEKYGVDNPSKSNKVKDKIKQTFIRNYGVECSFQSDIVKNKIRDTLNSRYGIDNPMDSHQFREKIRQTNIERYGVANPSKLNEIKDKIKTTCNERYGVDHYSKTKEFSDRVKQTWLEKTKEELNEISKRTQETNLQLYGVPFTFQNEDIKRKIRKTLFERHGGTGFSSKDISQRIKQTMLRLYGYENASQVDEIRHKMENTCLARYGVINPATLEIFKQKQKQTNIARYGYACSFKNFFVKEKFKQTCVHKYDVPHPMMNSEISNKCLIKSRQTMFNRYGVDYFMLSEQFNSNRSIYLKQSQCRYVNDKYKQNAFGSSWEFRVYDFLSEKHIEFEYQPSIFFEYDYCGKVHTYHPDFKIENRIYEVKGEQFYRINEQGVEEMYCPYRKPEWTDEYYNYLCGLYEAKHQCMLKNNVVILRQDQIKNLSVDMFIC